MRRDGRFVKLFEPGRFTEFDPLSQLSVETVKILRAEIAPEKALLIAKSDPDIAEENSPLSRPARPRSPSSP